MDAPVKSQFRLAKKDTKLGDIDARRHHAHGLPGCGEPRSGALRGPAHLQPGSQERARAHRVRPWRTQLPGGPLARVEGRVSLERILDRMADIAIDEEFHGPADDRRYTYEPTFILRGLTELNITFTPVR